MADHNKAMLVPTDHNKAPSHTMKGQTSAPTSDAITSSSLASVYIYTILGQGEQGLLRDVYKGFSHPQSGELMCYAVYKCCVTN